jgi:hypothetical protein
MAGVFWILLEATGRAMAEVEVLKMAALLGLL